MINYYLSKVKYTKQMENGTFKRVTEPYIFNGLSFTDVEARIYEELGAYIRGEFTVTSIAPYKVHEIASYNTENPLYKVSVSVDSIDDDSEKRKVIKYAYLTSAENVKEAIDNINEHLSSLMADYEITKVEKTEILEVFLSLNNSEIEKSKIEDSVSEN